MDARLLILFIVLLALVGEYSVKADFFYNHIQPKPEELSKLDLKCIPGRTVIKIEERITSTEDSSGEEDVRRSHMNAHTKEEYCKICVCSVEGKDEQCTRRPARNINECIEMSRLVNSFHKNIPFDHERNLAFRIRRVGEDQMAESKCLPFVSEYSDCSDANICSGCTKCSCTAEGKWSCQTVYQCPDIDESSSNPIDDQALDTAVYVMEDEMKKLEIEKARSSQEPLIPPPTKYKDDVLLEEKRKVDDVILSFLSRGKRSVDAHDKEARNSTVKFHHTIDELNEDKLLNVNISGTLRANKLEVLNLPKISRRTGVLDFKNKSDLSSLQIEHKSKIYDHITDNKIDHSIQGDERLDAIDNKVQEVIGNHTQNIKDRDVSKIVVNELKKGKEIIGDKNAPVMSNITFTPENDTLTAMAFIAGNLLNKLWNMEKDSDDESIETEMLKHEKIADLLDLFKEPLTLRQETFLKNALQQLSHAIDNNKNIKNISLCENVEEINKRIEKLKTSSEEVEERKENISFNKENSNKKTEEKQSVATEAMTKINNVLTLMQKYENIQKDLTNLQQKSDQSNKNKNKEMFPSKRKEFSIIKDFTKEESESLNMFGHILEKITKLLLPKKNIKRIAKGVRNQNLFRNTKDVEESLKIIPNMDLEHIKLTSKDRLVLDYMKHINGNRDCLFKNHRTQPRDLPNIDKNILLNLSEFFKMKSFGDLLKLLQPDDHQDIHRIKDIDETKNIAITTTEKIKATVTMGTEPSNLTKTKEKLKAHLKTILEDLIEIQNASGTPSKGNIRIVDALPCIYNILNIDKSSNAIKGSSQLIHIDKIKNLFNSLKKDLKSVAQTRRSNIIVEPRPKSAVIWERVVKNLNEKRQNTRRSYDEKPVKSLKELETMLEIIESSNSNTYKNYAFLNGVPPADRMTLLKTLKIEAKKYTDALENIKNTLEISTEVPTNTKNYINEFIDNAVGNNNLSVKVLQYIDKTKADRRFFVSQYNSEKDKIKNLKRKLGLRREQSAPLVDYSNVKVTRDELINQLIKNRIQHYIRVKDVTGFDHKNDLNYEIAKKILIQLESGNDSLARELYKIFVSQNKTSHQILDSGKFNTNEGKRHHALMSQKVPLIQFEEPKNINNQMQLKTENQLLKQLLNIQSMRS